ncbi:hypothetical protein ACHAWX_000592 [Stephanocyclus meneghinianus]
MPSSKVRRAIRGGVVTVLVGAATIFYGVLKSSSKNLIARQSPAMGHVDLSLSLDGDRNAHIGLTEIQRKTRALQSFPKSSFFDPKTVEQKPVADVAVASFAFDPTTIQYKHFDDIPPLLEDGTYLLFTDLRHRGPNKNCKYISNQQDRIKRIHYHFASCWKFDHMFGNRLALVYGIKIFANALQKPFTFTCELREGEAPRGAAYLMDLYSQNNAIGPIPRRNGKMYTAEEVCRLCSNSFCSWYDLSLDLASDMMISDWTQLTRPELVPIPNHDDALIHLRLGDALYSAYGDNEGKGIFPHGTYINLLKQAQEEKGVIGSIGIVTSPFKGSNVRVFDSGVSSISETIALDLMRVLQAEFPHATIRLHNSPDATIIESQARIVHARKVAICGCSTFCPYALLATEGIGFMYNSIGGENIWVRNAAKKYRNFRLFEAPLLNGLVINNTKSGWMLQHADVLSWMQKQNPNVGNVDIFEAPIFRYP